MTACSHLPMIKFDGNPSRQSNPSKHILPTSKCPGPRPQEHHSSARLQLIGSSAISNLGMVTTSKLKMKLSVQEWRQRKSCFWAGPLSENVYTRTQDGRWLSLAVILQPGPSEPTRTSPCKMAVCIEDCPSRSCPKLFSTPWKLHAVYSNVYSPPGSTSLTNFLPVRSLHSVLPGCPSQSQWHACPQCWHPPMPILHYQPAHCTPPLSPSVHCCL